MKKQEARIQILMGPFEHTISRSGSDDGGTPWWSPFSLANCSGEVERIRVPSPSGHW